MKPTIKVMLDEDRVLSDSYYDAMFSIGRNMVCERAAVTIAKAIHDIYACYGERAYVKLYPDPKGMLLYEVSGPTDIPLFMEPRGCHYNKITQVISAKPTDY